VEEAQVLLLLVEILVLQEKEILQVV
jgi:hypothetical protein